MPVKRPKPSPPSWGFRAGQRGFALIIVLWGLVLIGLLIGQVTANGRSEVRIASNLRLNAAAAAAADGAVVNALFHFLDPDDRKRWDANGAMHQIKLGESQVTVRIWDESGGVNPNLASEALLTALLRAVGVSSGQSAKLAATIAAWRGPVDVTRSQGATEIDYRAAGLDYLPPSAPVEDIDELRRVLGMTPEIMAMLKPHLSLANPDENPVAEAADPIVQQALASVPQTTDPAPLMPRGQRRYALAIETRAAGPGGAQASRRAIVRTGPGLPKGYQILGWSNVD